MQACRVLKANGHDDYIWGHVTVRDRAGRGMWMKPAGLGFEEVEEDDVILIAGDGEVIVGDRPRHSEWPIHSAIMAARQDVNSVVHSHPPYAIALAAAGHRLLPLAHAGTLFYPPDVPRFDQTSNLILTTELGSSLAEALGSENAMFMVNHGIVTSGASLKDAVVRAVLLEKACQQQLIALQAGAPLISPGPEAAREKRATVWPPAHLDALWDYLVRTLPGD
ncbi:class II aldolase/adducin family protein [Lacisediminihabitans profunda]|uniref:class II aldolase/adducin family protein n=1 Tax=Lacisediminihabitans profunda TaxID=2594790 RepID=UPI002483148A|nr:class II aldolase/adducin family protein [Lacisediminihabitans profunda]